MQIEPPVQAIPIGVVKRVRVQFDSLNLERRWPYNQRFFEGGPEMNGGNGPDGG